MTQPTQPTRPTRPTPTTQPTQPTRDSRLAARATRVGYGDRTVLDDVTVPIPDGSFTAVIGPNACGKSTLLRALARVLTPSGGQVVLDGRAIQEYRSKEVARRLGLLPQTSVAPDGIRVADLVARGRAPHQSFVQQWRAEDEAAVAEAMAATGVAELSDRFVDELSGGQRQRVWVALLLAQETPILLLDEPTTYLDIAHQYQLLELLAGLHRRGRTVVTVLHDLNQAARYADHLVVLREGGVVAAGPPTAVLTAALVADVFDLPCLVAPDPVTGTPAVFPLVPAREPAVGS